MKKNTTVPQVTTNEVTAAEASNMIDAMSAVSLDATLVEAFSIADLKNIKSTYLVALVEKGYSVEAITNASKEFDAMAEQAKEEAEAKAKIEAEEKAEEERIAKYQSLWPSDRVMLSIVKTIKDFNDNDSIASEIYEMIIENVTSVKLASFIGKNMDNENAMKTIRYIYSAVKTEKEIKGFSNTFVRVVEELCK